MHIILTHPNADFDAIASLLGAWFLYPDARPVLPPTINRNVRDFITLYENMLPFLRQNELEREPIDRLTLVDTQQVPPNIKHLADNFSLHVIDHHHDSQSNLPPGTVFSLTDTGANATLLVEQLRETAKRLSPIEATLLLLGIYEDTGALTYGSTTPRDLRAAAWLLADCNARLDIVREYLNYPMSTAQTELYEQIVDRLETHTIHGHTIVIGPAQVNHYVEEISSLASRIRDLYQPDGLFILVKMADHIQIVARSVTDAINVGHIAEYFGGGGHPRAAAALIKKNKDLAKVKASLVSLLRLDVQPAATVAQIMSRGVRTLAPNDTVRHTAEMMERYGHEGFPVIDPAGGKIVGIMSRREVDKARRHRLDGAHIRQFMKKGEFYVTPDDSIDTVQRLMTGAAIGQVPVVERPGGPLIGIVTRTDLINLWQLSGEEPPPEFNLANQLAQTVAPDLFNMLAEAGKLAEAQGDSLYIVGGFVRDLLLTFLLGNHPAAESKTSPRFDLDLVVEGDAINLAKKLQEQHGGRVRSHSRFGTAKWILDQPIRFNPEMADTCIPLDSLDFVTARTEFYRHPSALPEVEKSSIKQDLHRRDFTINTLALNLTPEYFGELLDFYGGQNDLESRLLRVLHSLSFVEDPTRMLRAARLLARLEFLLEERTAELLNDALDLLGRVSGERITHELELIFKERHPERALQQLEILDILAAIHPGLVVDDLFMAQAQTLQHRLGGTPWQHIVPAPVHYLGLMSFSMARDEIESLVERLNLRSQQRTTLKQVYRIKRSVGKLIRAKSTSSLYRLLTSTSDDARLIAWLAIDNQTARQKIMKFQAELRDVEPLIDGHYLKEKMGLSPGPLFRDIIEALRDARLDGKVHTLSDEQMLVAQLVAAQSA